MTKNIIIAILLFLLVWGSVSNVFEWNVETVVVETRDTIYNKVIVRDTIEVLKPVTKDHYIRVLPIATSKPIYSSEGRRIDVVAVELPNNHYTGTSSRDSVELKYNIYTEGFLKSFDYELTFVNRTINNTTEITKKKYNTFAIYGTLGSMGAGLDFVTRKYGVGYSYEPFNKSHHVSVKYKLLNY